MANHPWLVVDTWGTDAPTGCWTEGGARALAARLSLSWSPGRYTVEETDRYRVKKNDG